MGDPATAGTTGFGGGKGGGGAGGGGQDPGAGMGGADPSFGGMGFDATASSDSSGIGGGGAAAIPPPEVATQQAQQAFQGGQLNPQQTGDQPMPSSPVRQQNQPAQPQPSMRQPTNIGQALLEGHASHRALTGQPGGQQFASLTPSGNPLPAVDPDPEQTNIDPSQRPEWTGNVHQFKNTDASISEPWAPLQNTKNGIPVSAQSYGGGGIPTLPQDTGPTPVEPIKGAGVDYTHPPTTQITEPPGPDKAPVINTLPKPPVASPETASHTMLPPGTDTSGTGTGTTGTGTSATPGMGGGMHNPFEQLVGQLMHMILGQGMGALEHMIGRALGINTHGLFSSLFGGGFNPPAPAPGSGYFPPGTTGGRTVQPGTTQTPEQRAPGSPQAPPGPPGSQGNPPSAIAPRHSPGSPGAPAQTEMPQSAFDRNNKRIPAPIRYANPGGQASSTRAKQLWGSTDAQILHPGRGQTGAGKSFGIAGFPTPSHGLASNMDLLATSPHYRGQTIGNAIRTWSGGYRSTVPGYNPNTRITDQMLKDPKFMIPFFREMQKAEAGKVWMTAEQEQKGFDMYIAGSAQAYEQSQRARQIQAIRFQPQSSF